MTPTRDLATCFARAVLDRIETDRCCNSDNIGDAIFREMAVSTAEPERLNVYNKTVTVPYIEAENFMGLLRGHNAPPDIIAAAYKLFARTS